MSDLSSHLYSAEAEQSVLGSMLSQPQIIDDTPLLKSDFFVPAHQELYDCMWQLHSTGQAVEARAVHQYLADRGLDKSVGSPGILAELFSAFATHLTVGHYAKIIREKSTLRTLQSALTEIATDIQERPEEVSQVLGRAETLVCGIASRYGTGSLISASEAVSEYEDWRGKIQRGEMESRLKTGIQALDATNGGFPVPSYVVIAGEQGMGKSALIIELMKNACLSGLAVGGFTMEMTVNQVVTRMVANIGDINSRRLNGKIHPEEEEWETHAKDKIRRFPFYLERRSGLTPHDIRVMTRQMVKKGCKIVWLDNAQLMQGSSVKEKRVEQLTEVSRTIQALQKEHNIVFILLAQVTREAQKRGNMRTFDLADCAAFERDARVVVFLERKQETDTAPTYATPLLCRIAKYSEGEIGDFEVTFNKQKQRIT